MFCLIKYFQDVLSSSRMSGIGFGEYGEYKGYSIMYNDAKHLLDFQEKIKTKT